MFNHLFRFYNDENEKSNTNIHTYKDKHRLIPAHAYTNGNKKNFFFFGKIENDSEKEAIEREWNRMNDDRMLSR